MTRNEAYERWENASKEYTKAFNASHKAQAIEERAKSELSAAYEAYKQVCKEEEKLA